MSEDVDLNSLEAFDPSLRPQLESSLEGMDFLDSITQDINVKVPETVFVNQILPHIVPAKQGEKRDLTIWVNVTGSPMRGMDIVDGSGNVKFVVPPLLKSPDTSGMVDVNYNIDEAIITAIQKSKVFDKMGDAFLRSTVVDKVKGVGDIPINTTDAEQWSKILEHYGYEPIIKSKDGNTESTKVTPQDTFDLDEYDDI